MTKINYIIVNDPGYEYFNPDNAVGLAVEIFTNGEEPFDAMDVPIKNTPLFLRYNIALRNLIIKLIDLGVTNPGWPHYLYDGSGGHVIYWISNDKLSMEFHNYYCENENIYLPNIIPQTSFNSISLIKDYWHLYDEWVKVKLYKNNSRIEIYSIKSVGVDAIKLKWGEYNPIITDQYIQWHLSGGIFSINGEEFSKENELIELPSFIIYQGDKYPSQGGFLFKQHDEMFPDKDSSLKFLIIDSTSFQVFIDTYSDGIYDWDSGIILWSDYYN